MNDLIEIAEKVIGESKKETGVLLLLLKSLEFDANNPESEAFIEATVGGHFLSRCPTNSLPCAKHALLTVDPDARSSDFVRLGLTKLSEFGNDFENLAKGDVECDFAETSELQRNVELRNSSNEVVATVDLFVKFFDGSFGYSHKPTFRSTDEVRYCLFPRIISTDPRLDYNGLVLFPQRVSHPPWIPFKNKATLCYAKDSQDNRAPILHSSLVRTSTVVSKRLQRLRENLDKQTCKDQRLQFLAEVVTGELEFEDKTPEPQFLTAAGSESSASRVVILRPLQHERSHQSGDRLTAKITRNQ